tara:strand:- start:569 stop:925 length:357 start_codon:yes stop_codon:yes gene_type:complete
MEIDKKIIFKLIQTLEDLKKSLKGIEIDNNEKTEIEELEISGTIVKSPIVGTAYLAPEPGGKKFVEIGKKIKKGDTVIIVEAMKTMNHIPSPSDGTVKEISVEDGQPIEFGQKIIILE